MCVCIYTYTHIYVHMYTHICLHTYAYHPNDCFYYFKRQSGILSVGVTCFSLKASWIRGLGIAFHM